MILLLIEITATATITTTTTTTTTTTSITTTTTSIATTTTTTITTTTATTTGLILYALNGRSDDSRASVYSVLFRLFICFLFVTRFYSGKWQGVCIPRVCESAANVPREIDWSRSVRFRKKKGHKRAEYCTITLHYIVYCIRVDASSIQIVSSFVGTNRHGSNFFRVPRVAMITRIIRQAKGIY